MLYLPRKYQCPAVIVCNPSFDYVYSIQDVSNVMHCFMMLECNSGKVLVLSQLWNVWKISNIDLQNSTHVHERVGPRCEAHR